MLTEEREKSASLSQHLTNANKNIVELKKRVSKAETKDKG